MRQQHETPSFTADDVFAITKDDIHEVNRSLLAFLVDTVCKHNDLSSRGDTWRYIGLSPKSGREILSGRQSCSWPVWYYLRAQSGLTSQTFTIVEKPQLIPVEVRSSAETGNLAEFQFILTGLDNDDFRKFSLTVEEVFDMAGEFFRMQISTIEKPMGWYWSNGDPTIKQQMLSGPFHDCLTAAQAAHEAKSLDPYIASYARPEISCDVFKGRNIFALMETLNVEAIVPGTQIDWPSGEEEEELERTLAGVLFQFLDQRKIWGHFNALVEMGRDE